MTVPSGATGLPHEAPETSGLSAPDDTPAHKAVRLWVHQFARTLKTCRLYEQNGNTTVERFLDELGESLASLLDQDGPLVLRFTSMDVLFEGASLYAARTREDNLALPFYRDGIRGITLLPGISRDQIEALIAAIIRVTALHQTDDDLVTLLWEAHLDHIDIDYVPAEGDIGSGDDLEDEDPMPWPTPEEEPSQVISVEDEGSADEGAPRSDDWMMREFTTEVEAGFAELESLAATEVQRFHTEYQAEHQVPVTTAAIAVVQAYLSAGVAPSDAEELGRFLPRVLREALAEGGWVAAAEALTLLERHGGEEWSSSVFGQEIQQGISLIPLAAKLDEQDAEAVLDFMEFARRLSDTEIDLMIAVLAVSESRRNRRMLSEAVIQRCSENPERLAPWLADPRWFVVRNVVHMLGTIGGAAVVGLLEGVLRHPEPRVRYGVVASLSRVPRLEARPLLLAMLEEADTRTFCSALQVLAGERDEEIARRMLVTLQHPDFVKRPGPEKRAVYQALAATGDDPVVPDLEAELHRGNWFTLARDEHTAAIARCLARIGTLQSMQALERGARSRRTPVRRACEEALLGWAPHE